MFPVIPFGHTNALMAGDWYAGHTSDYHRFRSVVVSIDDFRSSTSHTDNVVTEG